MKPVLESRIYRRPLEKDVGCMMYICMMDVYVVSAVKLFVHY